MKSSLCILTGMLALLAACQPEPDNQRLYDELVVSTGYDPEANFASYATYAIPTDTVGFVSNASADTLLTNGTSTFPRPVLSALRFNLESRGYTRVDKKENPDLGINVVVVNDYNLFQQVVYPDPYYYPGSYYSGYYGYNSWYSYPYVQTYESNSAVLMIEIVDLKNRTPDNNVRVIWTARLGDLYSTINLIGQVEAGIDQAFKQSPYIGNQGGS